MKAPNGPTRTLLLLAVLAVLSGVALMLHRHEIRGTIYGYRKGTPASDGPPLVRDAVRSTGCDASTRSASPRGELFALPDGRKFTVHGPRRSAPDRALPLLVVLHGWGDDGNHFADWFAMHEHVGDGAFTVYPDADGAWDVNGDRDVEVVDRIVRAVASRQCIDPSRLFAFGFSWGGRLASNVACAGRTPFRAVAVGDSSYHTRPGTCRPSNVFVTVRTHDDDERPEGGKAGARRWAENGHCSPTAAPLAPGLGCVEYPGCADGKRVVLCEDDFFDPSWPKAWNHTVRPEHQDLAWRFFTGELRGAR